MQLQRDVRIFRRILRRTFDIHLIKTYTPGSLAGEFVITDGFGAKMPQCKIIHIMRTVGFQHIGLKQRVMDDTVQGNAMIGKNVLVVLEILPHF